MMASNAPQSLEQMDAAIQGILRLGATVPSQGNSTPQGLQNGGTNPTNQNQNVQDNNQLEFIQLCASYGVSQDAYRCLGRNGVTSFIILCMLQPGDLEAMELQIGQLRLIQAMVATSHNQAPEKVQPNQVVHTSQAVQAAPSQTVERPSSVVVGGSAEPEAMRRARRHLGLASEGEKVEYLKIRDYVTVLSKSMEDEKVVELPDGSTIVPKGSAHVKPKLENITALQYTEAAMAILGKLVLGGTITSLDHVVQYAGYIAVIARLGQEKDWRSVVRFDDAYRAAQVAQSLPWGEEVRDLGQTYIKERLDRSAKQVTSQKQQTGAHKGGGARSRNKGPKKGATGEAPTSELRICRDFSSGSCTRSVCSFRHLCAECGSGSHGLSGHPN